ncbi:ribonuclease P [Thermosipho melanesiensis]|uniref:Ribonuclease P protein component n=2 Tax=Thermosipho melanesiensis TaxID=46541 RepID=A6LNH2_THEM4|nr:ribonuclease P protein component [Thermosipho melanesiensis]ABR31473.1 ribonuclease P protein component [Thermosipho melanesiensis BI429]APT74531.1 ribonuclease P [Thermosipho melanesiensis]OOC36482.1 ribonuclease P [Thermosipho melanesiensis]OOC37300.1 ribonuclease P [Thermosipho melanesiensis]OOC38053.1 ribonuclease P [Thermosipho melanesiensis]
METNGLKGNFFKKYERLKLRKDFKRLYETGKSIQVPYFVIIYLKNGFEYSRFGFSVRKKFGKAVRRNRLKRWMREVIRTNKYVIPKGYDYLIIARKHLSRDFEKITYQHFKEELLKLFARIDDEENNIGVN